VAQPLHGALPRRDERLALGHADRARTNLTEFLRIYKTDDGFTRNAREALARLR